jgi:hypothetical protein
MAFAAVPAKRAMLATAATARCLNIFNLRV